VVEEIRLPPLGQTSDEMGIVEWYKSVGDTVAVAEPLLCVETDKAQVDVESAEEGVLLAILAEPGENLESGALIAYVGAPGEALPGATPTAPPEDAGPPGSAAAPPAETRAPGANRPVAPASPAGARVQASPLVRKLAADLGVDLAAVAGTGPHGRVERDDVERARLGDATPAATTATETPPSVPRGSAANATAPSPLASTPADADAIPAARRAIARRLTRSVQTIPQFQLEVQLNAHAARALIDAGSVPGLTYTHLLLRAMARAARSHAAILRVWDDEGPRYRTLPPDIGLAVAADDALRVVTIGEPDRMPLSELVAAVRSAAARGRDGALAADDLRPAALSLSNLGMFGVDAFHAIVDPDQTAILATGTVRDRVAVADGALVVAPMLTAVLACDHRTVDGAEAARFLDAVRTAFESDPAGPAS
jgi:pyruvate dehydrogenase E2 component (dihydrolipoamide acetyltransferase)